ncbi:MAG: LEA type 2 family protein [Vicinamibacterales bacterium]
MALRRPLRKGGGAVLADCADVRLSYASVVLTAMLSGSCASLGSLTSLVQAPRIDEAPNRQAEIRLMSPGAEHPLGGAGVRLWARVTNPNPFGFTVTTLRGTLRLENSRAATVDFPLGLPLAAGGQAVVPIDLTISFAELPELSGVLRRAIGRQPVGYRLEGTIGVEAGRLGTPVFGPMTLLTGTVQP